MKSLISYFNTYRYEWLILIALVTLIAIPRLANLDYSHFYGDETKVLYIDKTVSAKNFFLDQRKGPIQFFVAWSTEKVVGFYSELWTRLPFAIAGILASVVLYLLIRDLYGYRAGILAAILFGFNGFFIAFARTVQYQSFLFLIGFSALYLVVLYKKHLHEILLFLSGFLYALAFLTHYDAVFFLIPALFLLNTKNFKHLLGFFIPLLLITAFFYIPYFYQGHFESNTQGYLYRRLTGQGQELVNNSFYTNSVYNPNLFYSLLLVTGFSFALFYVIKTNRIREFAPLLVWFCIPFVVFTFVFKNPGTHIINFIIPAIILASVGFSYLVGKLSGILRLSFFIAISIVVLFQMIVSFFIFIPDINFGYPWKNSHLGFVKFDAVKKESQLFLYGFPYNRSWQEVGTELRSLGVRGYYTNDNIEIAQYYVGDIPITRPGANFFPSYYVDVVDNQELRFTDTQFLSKYSLVKSINSSVKIYRLN